MRVSLRFAATAMILALTLAACGSTSTGGAGGKTASLQIKGFAFTPAALTVDKGTVVTVTNAHGTTHTVTSGTNGTKDGKFDRSFDGGSTGTMSFDTVGTFIYFCSIHGVSMSGTIVVK